MCFQTNQIRLFLMFVKTFSGASIGGTEDLPNTPSSTHDQLHAVQYQYVFMNRLHGARKAPDNLEGQVPAGPLLKHLGFCEKRRSAFVMGTKFFLFYQRLALWNAAIKPISIV